jgi:hypothetical protein
MTASSRRTSSADRPRAGGVEVRGRSSLSQGLICTMSMRMRNRKNEDRQAIRAPMVTGASAGCKWQDWTEVARQGLAAGHEITAFVRSPARFRVTDPRLAVKVGDARKVADLAHALEGQEARSLSGPASRATSVKVPVSPWASSSCPTSSSRFLPSAEPSTPAR